MFRKSKRKLSPRSYPIQCERKWKYSFLSAAIPKRSAYRERLAHSRHHYCLIKGLKLINYRVWNPWNHRVISYRETFPSIEPQLFREAKFLGFWMRKVASHRARRYVSNQALRCNLQGLDRLPKLEQFSELEQVS